MGGRRSGGVFWGNSVGFGGCVCGKVGESNVSAVL